LPGAIFLPAQQVYFVLLLNFLCKHRKYHKALNRDGIKIFKALARLASNSKFLLAKSEKNSPKSCLC
jgi:hypothetical protein